MEYTPTLPLVDDESASPRVKAVFDDIRATRQTDFINNFWRALANDPANLERTWQELKELMAPGTELDPMIKELIYVAVSTVNNCTYCVRSHTAAARAKAPATPRSPSCSRSSPRPTRPTGSRSGSRFPSTRFSPRKPERTSWS